MIKLENISFSYGAVEAICNVSLSLPAGIFGLLGPNGAGKTTLMKLLLGFLVPAHGRGEIMGQALADQSTNPCAAASATCRKATA